MRLTSILFLISFSIAQDMQVKYVVAYTIDVNWGGEIETVSEITTAPGYAKYSGRLNPKRWIFRILGGERGMIKVPGTKNIMGYNAKRKRYWVTPLGEFPLFADIDLGGGQEDETEEKEESTEISITADTEEKEKKGSRSVRKNQFSKLAENVFENDDDPPQVERILNDGTEIINGFRTNKLTTTISTKSNKLIIEEWMVDDLPLRDSLYSYLFAAIEMDTVENSNFPKYSSHDFFRGVDSTYAVEQSDGEIVMAKLTIDSDNGWVQWALFEIRELYAVPFDALSFTIPEEYERIEIEKEESE